MNVNNVEKVFNLKDSLQNLFQTETQALIAWNLLIYKELTIKQLAELSNKDDSTIFRNLKKLEELGMIIESRTELIRNIKLTYWKLNPKIPLQNFGDLDILMKESLINNDLEFIKIMLVTIQRILWSIFNLKIQNIHNIAQTLKEGQVMSLGLMDSETGKLFQDKICEFLLNFSKEYGVNMIPIEKINEDSYLTFIMTTRFPSLDSLEKKA